MGNKYAARWMKLYKEDLDGLQNKYKSEFFIYPQLMEVLPNSDFRKMTNRGLIVKTGWTKVNNKPLRKWKIRW